MQFVPKQSAKYSPKKKQVKQQKEKKQVVYQPKRFIEKSDDSNKEDSTYSSSPSIESNSNDCSVEREQKRITASTSNFEDHFSKSDSDCFEGGEKDKKYSSVVLVEDKLLDISNCSSGEEISNEETLTNNEEKLDITFDV